MLGAKQCSARVGHLGLVHHFGGLNLARVAHDEQRSGSLADDFQVAAIFVDALENASRLYESYLSSTELTHLIGFAQATPPSDVLTGGFDVPLTLQISTFPQ